MKYFFSLLFSACLVTSLNAQSTIMSLDKNLHQSVLNTLLQMQQTKVSSKVDAVNSYRVINQSTHDNTLGNLSDSVAVSYVTNGTSTYDYNLMLYAYNYPYNTSPMFNFQGIFTKPQVQYSNYKHWQINPSTLVYGFYQRDANVYDAAKNLVRDTCWYADSASIPNMLYLNTFDANNQIVFSLSSKYRAGRADSAFKQYFEYDLNHKLVKDSMYEFHAGVWRIVARSFYTYDVANNLTLIDHFANVSDTSFLLPLVEQLKFNNNYDASNRLINVQTSFYDGTILKPYLRDTFEYTAASSFHTSWRQHQYDGINLRWEPMSKMTKQLNAASLPDTIHIDGYNRIDTLWTPAALYVCKYDTLNNPVRLLDFEYNFTSFPPTPDFTTFYYYQSFVNTTNIAALANRNTLQVYPNPSIETVHIKGFETGDDFVTIQVYGMNGQLVRSEDKLVQAGEASMNTGFLASGTYVLHIQNSQGKMLQSTLLVKP